MNKTALTLIIAAVVLIVIGFALSQGSSATPATTTDSQADVSSQVQAVDTTTTTTDTASAEKVFTVEGKDYSFAPSTITVSSGDKVKIIFKNTDGFHDFRIDALGVATKKINGGETDTVEFTAGAAGSYEYYCSVGQHRQMGMKGTLIVQ